MDLESFERVDMRRARKEPTVASQRRAIRRRLDHEDHASRLQEFLAHRGITLPHSNVAGHTQTHTEDLPEGHLEQALARAPPM